MSPLQCILAIVWLCVANVSAQQISGTFKISKVAADTVVEQVKFNADKTADVVYGRLVKTLAGDINKWERSTKEVRGTYSIEKIEDRIAKVQATTPRTALMEEWIKKTIQFKEQGYDAFVVVTLKVSGEKAFQAPFLRKGNELVGFLDGSIFRKSFLSF